MSRFTQKREKSQGTRMKYLQIFTKGGNIKDALKSAYTLKAIIKTLKVIRQL